ncbi:MAG: ABC transporter permease [Chloroflexia bacterium]|nr:ABC transporter permease [Chloroflexia bacterium]
MRTYIIRRVLLTIPVLLGVSLAVFSMLHLLPVDPVDLLIMDSTTGTAPTSGVTDEMKENLRRELGLDRPIPVQFVSYIWNALQGDLGMSFRNNQPVTELLLDQLPYTIRLTLAGLATSIGLGLVLGILGGLRPNSWIDNLAMLVATFGVSMPGFWLGLMMIYFFALQLKILPALGTGSPQALILPAIALGFQGSAIVARLTRSSIVEIMRGDYITTARAKGLPESVVVLRHALRNALIPVITVVGLEFGSLMSGAVITETVFGRPGIGRLAVRGILEKDFPLVQGFVLFIAVIYVVTNLLVDLCYAGLDRRITFD